MAANAAAIANSSRSFCSSKQFKTLRPERDVSLVKGFPTSRPLKDKLDLVEKTYRAAQNFDPAIKKIQVAYTESKQQIWLVNSEGLSVLEDRPMVKIVAMVVAEKKGPQRSRIFRRRRPSWSGLFLKQSYSRKNWPGSSLGSYPIAGGG